MKFYFLLSIYILLFSACSSRINKKEEKGENTISINISESKALLFSELFEQVDYIPLETTDSSLIGTVERFRIFDNKVCILCDKSVLIFNKQTGYAEHTISKLGSAPGEYQSLYDVYYDSKTNIIELLDMNSKKIQQYNLKGEFIKTLSLPFMPFSFIKVHDGGNNYWFYNNNLISGDMKSKVVHFNANQSKTINEYFPIDTRLANFFFVVEGNNFVADGNNLLFFSCPSNTIYFIKENEEPIAKYTIDFGVHTVPQEFYEQNFSDIMEFSMAANKQGYIYFTNNFSANKHYISMSFFLEKLCFWNFYSIPSHENYTACIVKDNINNLGDLHINNLNTSFSIDKDYFYFLISADQFLKISQGNNQFTKFIKEYNIEEQSNPLLVKCKFKEKQ